MPELPDVEGFKRYLNRHAAGHRIEAIEVRDRMMLRTGSTRGLSGATLERAPVTASGCSRPPAPKQRSSCTSA